MLRAVGLFILAISFSAFPAHLARAQGEIVILSPSQGEAIQGLVPVMGTIQADGIQSGEVAFAYAENPTDTWFLIGQFHKPVIEEPLATWDTTTIADGVYSLRVQVVLEDGKVVNQTVHSLRVRNYTAVETPTPGPTISALPPTDSPTPAPVAILHGPTATPLLPNPAVLTPADLGEGTVRGAAAVGGLFVVLGLYLVIRKQFTH